MPQDIENTYFGGADRAASDKYANPFYGVPHQYLPRDVDTMLLWSEHFLLRFGFYRVALSRVSNYFITGLNIECDDSAAKQKYIDILEKLQWKQTLSSCGLNLLAYGNLFASVNQGFDRFMSCPQCKKITNIESTDDFEFTGDMQYKYTCPACAFSGFHEILDKSSKDIERINMTIWNPREILIRREQTTGASEFFWDIPAPYIKSVSALNNKFYSKKTPMVIYEAIKQKRMLAFNKKTFLHVKVPTPVSLSTGGKAVPHAMYLFDDFFMLKVLQRYNEAICFEDISPFRVISMSTESNAQANPILNQSAGIWQAKVQAMVKEHRLDPGAYHTFPFPVAYQQLGGQGKSLAPTELMQASVLNILNGLNIPQELYTMQLSSAAAGPALRLFENSWSYLRDIYNEVINHWGGVIGKIAGLPKVKISLIPVTLSDDMERKSVIGQLVAANAIARSEMLNVYGFDYKDQVRKKMEEEETMRDMQLEQEEKNKTRAMVQSSSGVTGSDENAGITPQDVLSQAEEIAQKLFPLDAAQRRTELQKIKAHDQTLYAAVKHKLEELTSGARSQGLSAAKQQ